MYLFLVFILILFLPIATNALTTAPVDITNMNIYEIQQAVDSGYINYEKITNIYLERINKYNSKYNAVLTINKNAIEEAKKLDIEYKKNGRKSLLHGLPILVKDNIDVIGPITKYIEDSAIILETISKENTNYQSSIVANGLKGIKIGIVKDILNTTEYNIKNLFNRTVDNLKSLGADIIYIDSLNLEYTFLNIEMCYDFNNYIKGTNSNIKSFNELLNSRKYIGNLNPYLNDYCNTDYSNSKEYSRYLKVKKKNINIANKIYENNGLDAIIYPTVKNSIIKIDNLYSSIVRTNASSTANLIGFPSLNTQMGVHKQSSVWYRNNVSAI